MDYKQTLNLPKTQFPMKANLPQREPETLGQWEASTIYRRVLQETSGGSPFILHDGPPYANGHIHIGHALNKLLKDFVVKSKTMEGHYSPFVPGWDCHGLPIEYQVLKGLGPKKSQMSTLEIRKACREYAEKFVNIQKEEFKRLGVFGEWEDPYLTMTPEYEASIVREFGRVVSAGGVYKGKKPVLWCSYDETALAEAEVEYQEHTSPSIYVKFPVKSAEGKSLVHGVGEPSVAIWTTTPWTLVGNMAITLHPRFKYRLVETPFGEILLAQDLIESCMKSFQLQKNEFTIKDEIYMGRDLEGVICHHPWLDREVPVILGEHVTLEQGTGCVHTAPGHGQEDYEVGLKYGLDVYTPVDHRGRFLSDAGPFAGKKVFDANPEIIQHLRQLNRLILETTLFHSYPHCWRCKNPVIFRATEQWFISMKINRLREKALEEIDRIRWIPKWGKDRIFGMLENRPDWCISRQRVWGVPIVAFSCLDCKKTLSSPEVIDFVAEQMEKEGGSDVWFSKTEGELLPDGISCSHCGGTGFQKENDILDVWFESGVSYAAVLKKRDGLQWPADLYLEGSDQHRGWFHSALLSALQTDGRAPYKEVLTHGFVVDGNGKKMSKSAGNVVAPQEVINRYGAEILRLWVASTDFREDVRISPSILIQLVETYRKIRNTCRFLLGNLYDFDPEKDHVNQNKFHEIDCWAMNRLDQLVEKVRRGYSEFEFHLVVHALNYFCAVDMSAVYLDVIKDRLYVSKADSSDRRAAQNVMYQILLALTQLMAPVLSFTADEIWNHLQKEKGKRSVFETRFPKSRQGFGDRTLETRWEKLLKIREEVSRVLEVARKNKEIGQSLEANVNLYAEGEVLAFLKQYQEELPVLFIVSTVNVFSLSQVAQGENKEPAFIPEEKSRKVVFSDTVKGLAVHVERSEFAKCERCWMYLPSVGGQPEALTLCSRCCGVLSGRLKR